MKLGFDNKREVILMVVVVLIAMAAIWRFLAQPAVVQTATKAPAAKGSATPTTRAADTGRGRRPWVLPKDLQPTLDPSLKLDLLRASESTEYEGGERNIFREQAEVVKVEKPVLPVIPDKPPTQTVYTPPPIPLKYYGYASKPGEARKIFLSNGDEVFVAEEGQVIQRRYKIGKITATSVEVEDVLNNNKQIIPLTQG